MDNIINDSLKTCLIEQYAIISDDANQKVGKLLGEEFSKQNIEVKYINVSKVDVKPCYGCGGCNYKTYGKCIVRDDGDIIYPILINAQIWIIVTSLTWGTYSFQTKRVLDKIALIGDKHYYVKGKELVKSIQGNLQKYYAIGIKDECSIKEKEVFSNLVAENVNIMGISGGSFIVDNNITKAQIQKIVKEISG